MPIKRVEWLKTKAYPVPKRLELRAFKEGEEAKLQQISRSRTAPQRTVEQKVPYAGHVLVTADGASWIWRLCAEIFPCHTQVVDWYHAWQQATDLAPARFSDDPQNCILLILKLLHKLSNIIEIGKVNAIMLTESPKLAIVIPTFNRLDDLMGCLRSLQVQTMRSFVCVVVDNGPSTDGTSEAVENLMREDPRFQLQVIGPYGCVVARNLGLTMFHAPLLMTFDDDVELVDVHTLSYVVEQFERQPKMGVLGLSEYYPDGRGLPEQRQAQRPPHTLRYYWRDTNYYPPGRINRWGWIGTKFHHLPLHQYYEVDHVRSSSMAFSRDAFEAVGGFCEAYTADGYGYRYETDLCIRIQRQGYRVVFTTEGPQTYHKVANRQRGWHRTDRDDAYLMRTNRNNTFFFLRNYWSPWTGWLFLLWDMLVGSSTQPGIYRALRYHRREALRLIRLGLRGKWHGWRLYWRVRCEGC